MRCGALIVFDEEERILIVFDEERILIVSFLPKSLSRVLWTSAAGIDREARRFQRLGAILDWLCGTYSLGLMCKCFLGRGELEFTRAVKLPITSSDVLPLSYRRLVGAKAMTNLNAFHMSDHAFLMLTSLHAKH